MNTSLFTFHPATKFVSAAIVLASISFIGTANATSSDPDYRPAHLKKGYCGSGTLEITVDGKSETVQCANLDTHSGRGYYKREHCYKVEPKYHHGGYGYKHSYGDKHSYGKSDHYGYYQRCDYKKYYYQLPVITIEKRAYDKYHKLISTAHSNPYHFDVWTNGGYGKSFQLKSKQKKYLIVSKDNYTISENAPYYKTRIECGGDPVHGQKVTVGISKPGQKVSCVFHNYKPYHKPSYHKPEHKPSYHKPEHKPSYHKPEHKPSYHKPEHKPSYHKPEYKPSYHHKPKACSAWGGNLDKAKYAYYGKCSVKLLDCDPMWNGYVCSSQQIGAYAPEWRR